MAPDRLTVDCNLEAQGFERGSCDVEIGGEHLPACGATLRSRDGALERLISTIHLSRPENYLSIYQSGCNLSCRKCHSWEFSQHATGGWMTPDRIADQAARYSQEVTLWEPRERATAWHAHASCRCCGGCVLLGNRPAFCPGVLSPDDIVYSPQGFGPARNIVAFTGGDLSCRPEFYAECTRRIKERTELWVLIETNGFGLTPRNPDDLAVAGVDSFWLDIKAYDPAHHRWLTGRPNRTILELPERMRERGFVLEVLSLHIPGLVEADELERIAHHLAAVDPDLPFTILAFFPSYRMTDFRCPTVEEMVDAYGRARTAGLKNVRVGNVGVFARTEQDLEHLAAGVGDATC